MRQQFHADKFFSERSQTLGEIRYSIAEAGAICAKILYNTEGVDREHFRTCMVPGFNLNRIQIQDHKLRVTVPYDEWRRLRDAFDRSNVTDAYHNLRRVFSPYGMSEFFDGLQKMYREFYS